LNIIWVNESDGYGIEVSPKTKTIIYTGEKISVSKK
jgi:hypothetical protein